MQGRKDITEMSSTNYDTLDVFIVCVYVPAHVKHPETYRAY